MKKYSGLITALATPFIGGELDISSFRRLVQFQKQNGVDGFVVNGTTGESPTLSTEEVLRLLEATKAEVGDDVSVIVGTGSNSTKKTIENTKRAKEWGAEAALVVVPYYNKPTQAGLVAHFQAIAENSEIPIILYNVPGRTVTALSLEAIQELSTHENVIGIKEASGDIGFGRKIREAVGETFLITSGDDATCIELCSTVGDGVISVISHIIPKQLKQALSEVKKNSGASKLFTEKFGSLLEAIYLESNPIGVKRALAEMEVFDSAELRLPLLEMSPEATAKLKTELVKLELI
ncbi:MAG: 4-hydroxy-tetrahydrodipicolinate synthase [Bdellovibrionales bacterium]|nr:4-hydroxy-tetrahydrodipicolinate synthase [Bdellovibrionales bacterium]